MHDPKNKNCQKSTCDEHHSALRNPIFGGTHECDCTCPEQKEEWEEEFIPIAEKLENVCTDYAPVEATWDFIRTQISLAEQRGRMEGIGHILEKLKQEETNKWDDAVHCTCLPAVISEIEDELSKLTN